MNAYRTVVVLCASAALVAGCGNSGDGKPPPTAPASGKPARQLTKAEYARATKALCARTDREMRAFIPLGTDPATRRANRRGIIALLRRQNEATRALGYPRGAPRKVFDRLDRDFDAALDRAAADQRVDIEQAIGAAVEPYMDALRDYAPDC